MYACVGIPAPCLMHSQSRNPIHDSRPSTTYMTHLVIQLAAHHTQVGCPDRVYLVLQHYVR